MNNTLPRELVRGMVKQICAADSYARLAQVSHLLLIIGDSFYQRRESQRMALPPRGPVFFRQCICLSRRSLVCAVDLLLALNI